MDPVPTNREIFDSVQDLAQSMQYFSTSVDQRFVKIDQQLKGIDQRFERIESTMATKDDLGRFATKDDLQEFKQEILTHVDWFAAKHQTFELELTAVRHATLRHEDRITVLEKKVGGN